MHLTRNLCMCIQILKCIYHLETLILTITKPDNTLAFTILKKKSTLSPSDMNIEFQKHATVPVFTVKLLLCSKTPPHQRIEVSRPTESNFLTTNFSHCMFVHTVYWMYIPTLRSVWSQCLRQKRGSRNIVLDLRRWLCRYENHLQISRDLWKAHLQ